MRILFITQFLPYPPDSGGKVKTWGILKLLAQEHEIYLISFVDDKKALKYEPEVIKKCSLGLKTFVTPIITSKHKKLSLEVIKGIFNLTPFRVSKYFLEETADFIHDLTDKVEFDAVYCNHLTSAPYLDNVANIDKKVKIYDEHNINSQAMFTYSRWEKNLLVKAVYAWEGIKFRIYEKRVIPRFNLVFAISENDKRILERYVDKPVKVKYLPTPFETKPVFQFGSKIILFVGLMSWWPNEQAVIWFSEKIFPLILRSVPKAEFWVIGANASKRVESLAAEKIKILGYVRNLEEYYQKSGVFIAPIRVGGGIRIKILDAFRHGIPVVSTTLGVSGIDADDGKELFIADQPEEFAESVVSILKSKRKSKKLSQAGLNLISGEYNSEKAVQKLDLTESI